MSAHAEVGEPVSVALIGRRDEARTQLQTALTEFGAAVVFEGEPSDIDLGALQRTAPGVVIVNLDPAEEDALDRLQPVFDDPSINVIFNEAEVTRQLGGWDLARWARHLAAKVLGHQDTNPPVPADAERLPGSHFIPRPGAPPTPAELAGERMIEEFTVEADDHADAIPTDYLPMEVLGAPAVPDPDHALGIDIDAIEGAMTLADAAAPTVSGAEVPGSAPLDEDAAIDFGLDLSVLDAALTAPPPVHRSSAADDAALLDSVLADFNFDLAPESAEAGPAAAEAIVGDASTVAALDEIDFAGLEAETGSGTDAENDTSIAAFARFDDGDAEYQLDEDVARLAQQLEDLPAAPLSRGDDGLDEFDFASVAVPADPNAFGGSDLQPDAIELAGNAPASPAASTAASSDAAPAFDFGALELAPMEDDGLATATSDAAMAGVTAAPAKAAPAAAVGSERSFDFGSLSLEPMGDEAEAEEADLSGDVIRRVIVLGASIGGPDALRGFLSNIPAGFPALFVLAQHLENGFFERLAQQLQKSARLPVRVAEPGKPAAHGEVLVVPADRRVRIAPDGTIAAEAHAEAPRYSPCIDDVMRDIADRFGSRATAVVFSGMAGDAIEGSVYLTSKGGEVWAQTPDSCVVSSMVDGASARGVVEFFGTPRELADRCVARYGG